MRTSLENIQKIDAYIAQELSATEMLVIKESIEHSPELSAIYQNQLLIQQAVNRQAILAQVQHFSGGGSGSFFSKFKWPIILSSLLKIQSSRMEDAEAVAAVRQGQQRVEAMSLIHQRLYQTDKVTNINIKEYISDLTESLMSAYGFDPDGFDLQLNIDQEELDVDIAMPLGLILNELITNSFKYAFNDSKRPLLIVNLKTTQGLTLEVQDNGPGLDLNQWDNAKKSFGKKLIKGLSKQLGGEIFIENRNGAFYRLTIPKEKLKMVA